MSWQTITVSCSDLQAELDRIRSDGGIITRCCPSGDDCTLTYCCTS